MQNEPVHTKQVIDVYAPDAPARRSPQRAAADLYEYANDPAVRGSHPAEAFGYRDHPNETVRQAQVDMGIENADGIYGPATRARGSELGVNLPPRPQA